MSPTDVRLYQICLLAKLFMLNSKLVETTNFDFNQLILNWLKSPFVTIFYWLSQMHPPNQILLDEMTYLYGHFDQ